MIYLGYIAILLIIRAYLCIKHMNNFNQPMSVRLVYLLVNTILLLSSTGGVLHESQKIRYL